MEIYFSYLYYENKFEQFNSRRTLTNRQTDLVIERKSIVVVVFFFCVQIRILLFYNSKYIILIVSELKYQ